MENDTKSNRASRNLKSILVEPFKQIKFGLYVIGVSAAFVLMSGALFVNAFREQYDHVMNIFNIVDSTLRWDLVLNDVFYTNAIRVSVMFATFIVVLFAVVFRMTHRYYGPLVSIERFLGEIKAGNYTARAKIREKDELQKLVASLNEMAEQLEERHTGQKLCQCAIKKIDKNAS